MPYCIHCGVKVNHIHSQCPLCNCILEYPESRTEVPPLYPKHVHKISFLKKNQSQKDWIVIHFIGFLTLLLLLLTSGIDYFIMDSLTWSQFSSVSLIYIYFTSIVIFYFKKVPVLLYTLSNLLLCLFLYSLDILTPISSWFLHYALPCFISLQLISLSIHFLFKVIKLKTFRVATILLITTVFLIIINEITSINTNWSMIISSLFIPTSIYLSFLGIKIKDLTRNVKS
jgi:hypothetical protein